MRASENLDLGFAQVGTATTKKVSFATFKPESATDVAHNDMGSGTGVTFTQTGERVITCYNCREEGHTVNECPKLDESGKEKFWEAFNNQPRRKKGFVNAAVAGQQAAVVAQAPTPAPALAESVVSASASDTDQFAQFQRSRN